MLCRWGPHCNLLTLPCGLSWLHSISELPVLSPNSPHPCRPHIALSLAVLHSILQLSPLGTSLGLQPHPNAQAPLHGFLLVMTCMLLSALGDLTLPPLPQCFQSQLLPGLPLGPGPAARPGCWLCNGLILAFSKYPAFLEIFVRWRLRWQPDLSCGGGRMRLGGWKGDFFAGRGKDVFGMSVSQQAGLCERFPNRT